MAKKAELKMVLTNRHEGICDQCGEPVIGFDAKIESFAAFLCRDCIGVIFDRRHERREEAERSLFKGEVKNPNEDARAESSEDHPSRRTA